MKHFVFGIVVVAFVTAITAPAFACGPNSRQCTLHHMYCECPKGKPPSR
jgi:hypothetical protein